MLAELKQCFLEAYDDNRDGKIDIREVVFFILDRDKDAEPAANKLSSTGRRHFCCVVVVVLENCLRQFFALSHNRKP